jgi:hypothetical protein
MSNWVEKSLMLVLRRGMGSMVALCKRMREGNRNWIE